MLAPVTHVLPFTMIRRERLLPSRGKVLVRAGQKIAASDVVAEANLHPEYLLIDVARALGTPINKADQYIRCQAGDQLSEGDIIAGPVGLSRRLVRTPRDGHVVIVGSGQVLIESIGKPFQVKAGLPGEVAELVADRGAVIESAGALIQGVWGNGRSDYGLLAILAKTPETEFKASDLDISLRGAIVMAGYCRDAETLKAAEDLPLRGLILSSMSAALISFAGKLNFPVVLLEGFGKRPFNAPAFKLLTTNERREVAVNAEVWDRYHGTRPEIFIPLPASQNLTIPQEMYVFEAGQTVRVLRSPHTAEVGQIQSLVDQIVLPSGIKSQAAIVRFENGETEAISLYNLEVIA